MADSSDKLLLFLNAAKPSWRISFSGSQTEEAPSAACFYPDIASEKRKISVVSILTKAGGK
jgi:hypothetical protein